jgi:tRNA threonylcarbamoyl adenosine modification protein (Sua5/YciO/YrdC/YwlC family)
MRVPIHPRHPEPRKIAKAAEALRRGEIVAFPTDTMYGIGCEIHEKKALDRIYQMKGMPKDRPLSFICPDLSDIARYAQVSDQAYRIMKRLLPGPYTFVLKATRDVPRTLMMKRKTVGIRVPDHPVPLALVRELGSPLITTSTTWQGEALVDPDEIDARFPGLAMVLDAEWGGSEPSTIVDLSGDTPEILREGAGPVDFM